MIGMLVMSVVYASSGAFSLPHNQETYLLYPREIQDAPLVVAETGAYALWVCAPQHVGSHVEVNGVRHAFAPERGKKNKQGPLWYAAADALELGAGAVTIVCGPEILAVALSKASEFHPETALSDMRVLPLDASVEDLRASLTRDTNTVFTLPPYAHLEEWERVADTLRRRILLGSGLYPLPEKTPLNARVFDETEYDDYAVAKVHFEAWPGFLVTGNLFRPLGDGPFPAVVNPHGHWEHGRLEDSERGSVAARCITLARMGAVALSYDMIGYVDSRQTPHNWGGAREKLWGLHPFGVQLWSSIRAVDFLETLSYVDTDRLGCTGGSGGGTQTFALAAVDPRIRVSSPVNMISSTMQGGCLCENAPLLRLNNSNMEIGALAAPRPQLLVSTTGDWTRETPRVEYPAIRSIYALYDAEDKVANVHLDYGHNYNQSSREAMYRFFGRHLIGGNWDDFCEPDYVMPDQNALRVFPGEEPPAGYEHGERLIAALVDQARARRSARLPDHPKDIEAFRNTYGHVVEDMLGIALPAGDLLESTRIAIEWRDQYVLERWVLGRTHGNDRIPALFYRSQEATPQDAVLLVHGRGKAMFATPEGGPGPFVLSLLAQGKAVLLVDPFLVGEHHPADRLRSHERLERFHDAFQRTDTTHRIQDILTALSFLRARYDLTGVVDLFGFEDGGVWCLFAGTVDSGLRRIVVDMNQMDLDDDDLWEQRWYIPGIRAMGDIPAAVYMAGPERIAFFNLRPSAELIRTGASITPGPLTAEILRVITR